jgi:hypothetical protein
VRRDAKAILGAAFPDRKARKADPEIAQEPGAMSDLVFVAASLVFFAIAVVYVHGCWRLKGGRSDA